MLSKNLTWLTSIDKGEEQYIKRILYGILGTVLVGIGLVTISTLSVGDYPSVGLLVVLFVLSAGELLLTWRNHLTIPRLALPLMTFLAAAYSSSGR